MHTYNHFATNPTTIVIQMIAEQTHLHVTQITPSSRLIGDLGLDSINLVELVSQLENKFDVHISNETIQHLETVENIIDLFDPSH